MDSLSPFLIQVIFNYFNFDIIFFSLSYYGTELPQHQAAIKPVISHTNKNKIPLIFVFKKIKNKTKSKKQ